MPESISRRAALSTTGRAAVAILASGGLSVAATDPNADARLFALEADLKAAIEAMEVAQGEFNSATDRCRAVTPESPVIPAEPKEYYDYIRTLTIGEFADKSKRNDEMESAHDRWSEDKTARLKAWEDECERLSEEYGVEDREAEYMDRLDAITDVAWEIIQTPAATLAGLMVKLRLYDLEGGQFLLTYVPEDAEDDESHLERSSLWEELIPAIAIDIQAMRSVA